MIAVSAFVLCGGFFFRNGEEEPGKVDQFFLNRLEKLQESLGHLNWALKSGAAPEALRSLFRRTRLDYKELSVLTDYFNPYETALLNGPELLRTEDDAPTVVLEPHGFQVLESQLWSPRPDRDRAAFEIRFLDSMLRRLQEEPDRRFKFKPMQVWQAMQTSLVSVTTLGLAGFDSPAAGQGLPESAAQLQALKDLLSIYENRFRDDSTLNKLYIHLEHAAHRLRTANTAAFDHLHFLREVMDPLYGAFVRLRIQTGLLPQGERYPLNPEAPSLFDARAFNLDFFSPNERYRMTPERIALGRKLFYDPALSGNGRQSCAGCHHPGKAFTDGLPQAPGLHGKPLLRNAPTLWNTVFQTRQFYDSRTATLENQLNAVVHNTEEMSGSLRDAAQQLRKDPAYTALFARAYPAEREPFNDYTIANAISSYVRSLVALNSRFDRYMRGENGALNETEKKGFNLFMGKGKCATCHFLPLFNGLLPPTFTESESEILGVPAFGSGRRPVPDADPGKGGFTGAAPDSFAFKTPTLRNIALTAPYMHNGVFRDLNEVMQFYDRGGGAGLGFHRTQTLPAEKLGLTRKEQAGVIAFLHTLTDTTGTDVPIR